MLSALRQARREAMTGLRLAVARIEWRRARRSPEEPLRPLPVRRLLLVPSDPATLIGARGDEAMMSSVEDRLRAAAPDLRVAVLVSTTAAATAALALGYEPIPVWSRKVSLAEQVRAIEGFDADAVAVLGADVMDGYYSLAHPTRVLLLADLLARQGLRVVVLGFSFNERPHPALGPIFDGVRARVRLNLRDPISFARFRSFSRAPATLVADSAFLLRPDPDQPGVGPIAAWTAARRAAGDAVLAFNVHPMLVKASTDADVQRLVDAAAQALMTLAGERPVSWLLLPHDYRGRSGDDRCLLPLAERLRDALGERVHHPGTALSAKALKAVAGLMDGVVTGRMHLAIAALGGGVPVAGLTYQDKFQGLFQHFGLPAELLLDPRQAMSAQALLTMLRGFESRLGELRAQVVDRWPDVRRLSEQNLAPLLPEEPT